jgi:hypothetical protein
MKKIKARFVSICAETGFGIPKGEEMIYNYTTKKCYSHRSKVYQQFVENEQLANDVAAHDAALVQAQENAFFDNFVQQNNI